MTPETITTIAALLLASAGWLAFAREKRAHRATAWDLWAANARAKAANDHLSRLTDRDERGRFVRRER